MAEIDESVNKIDCEAIHADDNKKESPSLILQYIYDPVEQCKREKGHATG